MSEQNGINRLQSEINAANLDAIRSGSKATQWLLLSVAFVAIAFFGHVLLVSHAVPPTPAAEVAKE